MDRLLHNYYARPGFIGNMKQKKRIFLDLNSKKNFEKKCHTIASILVPKTIY